MERYDCGYTEQEVQEFILQEKNKRASQCGCWIECMNCNAQQCTHYQPLVADQRQLSPDGPE